MLLNLALAALTLFSGVIFAYVPATQRLARPLMAVGSMLVLLLIWNWMKASQLAQSPSFRITTMVVAAAALAYLSYWTPVWLTLAQQPQVDTTGKLILEMRAFSARSYSVGLFAGRQVIWITPVPGLVQQPGGTFYVVDVLFVNRSRRPVEIGASLEMSGPDDSIDVPAWKDRVIPNQILPSGPPRPTGLQLVPPLRLKARSGRMRGQLVFLLDGYMMYKIRPTQYELVVEELISGEHHSVSIPGRYRTP